MTDLVILMGIEKEKQPYVTREVPVNSRHNYAQTYPKVVSLVSCSLNDHGSIIVSVPVGVGF